LSVLVFAGVGTVGEANMSMREERALLGLIALPVSPVENCPRDVLTVPGPRPENHWGPPSPNKANHSPRGGGTRARDRKGGGPESVGVGLGGVEITPLLEMS